jgi:type IV pilus assembly protein PilB
MLLFDSLQFETPEGTMIDEMTDEELLTFDEALQTLGTSRPTLYRLLSQGDIKGLKVGKQWRFRRADLQAYMQRGPVEISAAPVADIDAELAAFDVEIDSSVSIAEKSETLARRIVEAAIDRRASDIHIEPTHLDGANIWWVRYRIDGILQEFRRMPSSLQEMLTAQFKTMADMNVGEKRVPQDGRFRFGHKGGDFEIKLSTGITHYGESIVMRILDRRNVQFDLERVGLSGEGLTQLRELINQPNGVILFTGPSGSGKTTTLYSCLAEIASPQRKTMTIEDPIEMTLPFVTSCGINPRLGITFSSALRSFMRQDPDILYIGESRDRETIDMALAASLTGHLVLTQLHTNDAPSAVVRLLDIGIEAYVIAASLTGVLSQRLCRKVCTNCCETYEVEASHLQRFGWTIGAPHEKIQLSRGTGCEECRGRGFKGRVALFELMKMTEEINDLVVQRAPTSEIRKAAKAAGMKDMREDGLEKVLAGITTPDEVMRVLFTTSA